MCSFMKSNINVLKIDYVNWVSRMIKGILSHKYDIISGIFSKYLQMTKKSTTPSSIIFDFAWFYRIQPLKYWSTRVYNKSRCFILIVIKNFYYYSLWNRILWTKLCVAMSLSIIWTGLSVVVFLHRRVLWFCCWLQRY